MAATQIGSPHLHLGRLPDKLDRHSGTRGFFRRGRALDAGYRRGGDRAMRCRRHPRGRGVEFENIADTPGGVLEDRGRGHRPGVPVEYVRHVERGVREVLAQGVYAGYPFADVKVTLVAGRFRSVDTCGMDFRIAGSMALR